MIITVNAITINIITTINIYHNHDLHTEAHRGTQQHTEADWRTEAKNKKNKKLFGRCGSVLRSDVTKQRTNSIASPNLLGMVQFQ